MKNRFSKILIGIIILLALTNPTQSDFEKYAKLYSNTEHEIRCARTSYFLIFSLYEYKRYVDYDHEKTIDVKFIGVFKTFIEI